MLDFSSSPDPTCLTAWNREKVSLEKVEKSTNKKKKQYITWHTQRSIIVSLTPGTPGKTTHAFVLFILNLNSVNQIEIPPTGVEVGRWVSVLRYHVLEDMTVLLPQKNKLRFWREALVIQCSSLNVLAVVTWWYRAIEIKDCYLLHKTKPNNGVMSHWMFRHQSLLRTLYMGYVGASLEWGGTSVLERVSATLL